MKEAQMLLNEEAVKSILDTLSLQNRSLEAPGVLMNMLGQELQQITSRYYSCHTTGMVSILTRYSQLHPTDEQIRHALVLLMDVHATYGKRTYLFNNSRQWLAVFKVLVFLGVLKEEYGCMAHMEVFVRRLFANRKPRVSCNQDALTKKNICKPFSLDLSGWEKNKDSHDMADYWSVCVSFLQILSEECVTECVTSAQVPN